MDIKAIRKKCKGLTLPECRQSFKDVGEVHQFLHQEQGFSQVMAVGA